MTPEKFTENLIDVEKLNLAILKKILSESKNTSFEESIDNIITLVEEQDKDKIGILLTHLYFLILGYVEKDDKSIIDVFSIMKKILKDEELKDGIH